MMHYVVIPGVVIGVVTIIAAVRLLWELLQQNGRMLLRMGALEKRLKEIESAAPDAQSRADRFASHSLANSKIKRDGLKAGTPAPEFRLPRLDGGELTLSELRGKLVLLVFSSPSCGPCNMLAPALEKFHRKHPQLEMVMISKDTPEANREKVKEFKLTFPVVLQKKWEVSLQYAFFGTPVGYLIDSAGVVIADAAVGTDAVLELGKRARRLLREKDLGSKRGLPDWLDWINRPLGKLKPTYDKVQQR